MNDHKTILNTPAAEIEISNSLVEQLISDQFSQYANLTITKVGEGWDNVMFRLGNDLAIRIPRRAKAAKLIENEQKYLNGIAKRLAIKTSAPINKGIPSPIFPWHWSIIPWFTGNTADIEMPKQSEAARLMNFLKNLHQIDKDQAPKNNQRGVSLQSKHRQIIERLNRLKAKSEVIQEYHYHIVEAALKTTIPRESKWIHGDLHPKNIIVNQGIIEAIVDWGDVTSGDVATDLASVWMLFDDSNTRKQCINQYEIDNHLLLRSKAWAVFFGAILLDIGLADTPDFISIGRRTLDNVDQDKNFSL